MLLIVGGWIYGLGVRAGWDFVYQATVQQNLQRYVKAWNSVRPWWFFAYQTPADLLPWAVFLPAAIVTVFRGAATGADERATIAARAAGLFTLFGLLFFSGSSGKRGVYVMESFPAISLLIAASVLQAGRGMLGFVLMGAVGLVLGLAAPVAIAVGALRIPQALAAAGGPLGLAALVVAGCALAAGAGIGGALLRRESRRAALASAIGGSLVALFLGGTVGGAIWSRMQGARAFCSIMDAAAPKGERIAVDHAKFEQFMFYTLRKTTEYWSDEELAGLLTSGRCRYAILTREAYERLRGTAPVAGRPILAEASINGGAFVLLGPTVAG
jgi:4-amino-4-deoxy-L-arabinose transferase-like glycosyltransferase